MARSNATQISMKNLLAFKSNFNHKLYEFQSPSYLIFKMTKLTKMYKLRLSLP